MLTTDPTIPYATRRGAIQPFGGDLGYRGTALGLFIGLLSTLLAGDAVDDARRVGSNLAVIAIDPGAGFAYLAAVLGCPIDPARPVLLGDRERTRAVEAAAVPGDGPMRESLAAAAREVRLDLPPTIADD